MNKRLCIVGLGNPGPRYQNTPHNIGFEWLDACQKRMGLPAWSEKFDSEWLSFEEQSVEVHFLKPQTFMNLSGGALQKWKKKFPKHDAVIAVFDDIDLPLGRLRLKESGGDGGHRGLRSLLEVMGPETLPRFRIGVGREPGQDAADYVLSRFGPEAVAIKNKVLADAPAQLKSLLYLDWNRGMNEINGLRYSEVESKVEPTKKGEKNES